MTRRALVAYLSMAALAACSAGDTARPYQGPSASISDGAHQQAFNDPNGNPDFFFLPTMVPNPVNDPDFDPDDFNPRLLPTVEVCALDLPNNASENDVLLTTPCKAGGYFASFGAPVNGGLQKYQASWTIPVSPELFYRIRVKVGEVSLGFADVHTVANPSLLQTVDKDRFVGQQDGSNLPIPFRIEIGALCTPAGLRPCDSATLGLATGGTVNISTDDGNTLSGVRLPPQNAQSGNHTLTVQPCLDLNPRAIDLPTFGSCVRVEPTPALTAPLNVAAVVEVCDVGADLSAAGLTEEQEELVTLHKLHGSQVQALPHLTGCTISTGAATPSVKGVIRHLARGNLRGAVKMLARMAGPTPLHARRLDVGGAGGAFEFSDFQFALPAKMSIQAGNGQTAPHGTTLPLEATIKVTDLNDDPVANATVSFAVAQGSVGSASVTTGADGIAKTTWTLGATIGTQTATASGRGIAGANLDGPRTAFDPFMSIQSHFDLGGPDPIPDPAQPVAVQTGTQTFSASSIVPFGASGYSYKVVSNTTASPAGWQTPGFNEAGNGFVAGIAPFASAGRPCFYSVATPWAVRSSILVRKAFTLGAAGTVQVKMAMDTEVIEIYLNGVAMSGGPLTFSDCAVPNAVTNSTFTGSGVPGNNLIAVRVKARSNSSFLDTRISAP
ncbi:MAG TPA: Ig-like domain-containing protein [Gemmatimonadales bacterium]|nr:Ig-like domain-containing protein [Gemmatimonadales bacterium]